MINFWYGINPCFILQTRQVHLPCWCIYYTMLPWKPACARPELASFYFVAFLGPILWSRQAHFPCWCNHGKYARHNLRLVRRSAPRFQFGIGSCARHNGIEVASNTNKGELSPCRCGYMSTLCWLTTWSNVWPAHRCAVTPGSVSFPQPFCVGYGHVSETLFEYSCRAQNKKKITRAKNTDIRLRSAKPNVSS